MYNKKMMLSIIESKKLPYITVNMVNNLFYDGESYFSAVKVLRTLYDRGYLNRFSCKLSDDVGRGEYIYYPADLKPLDRRESRTRHRLQCCYVTCQLIKHHMKGNVKIKNIFYEYPIVTSKYKKGGKDYNVDTLVDMVYKGDSYRLIVESDVSHFTSEEKLKDIEFQYLMEKNKEGIEYSMVTLVIRPTVKECNKSKANIPNLFYLTPKLINPWVDNWLSQ